MQINIIIPYRPLCHLGMRTPNGPIYQKPDGRWGNDSVGYNYGVRWGLDEDELIRAIKFLNKNSHFKHRIVVVIDDDIFPNNNYLKEFDNVILIKNNYVYTGPTTNLTVMRVNAACIRGIHSIPNEEWLCFGYISDMICGKGWDIYIEQAIRQYGDNYVYVPMVTEIIGGRGNVSIIGQDPTPQKIWEEWRKTISCHTLSMPYPPGISKDVGFCTEDHLDHFISKSNQAGKPAVIIEKPGQREYGYYNVMTVKAKYAKGAMRLMGYGFDTNFDDNLGNAGLMKAVITRSFVFHPYCRFKY